jgi:hypothetical protein
MRCTKPSRGRARREEDEKAENIEAAGLERPPLRPRLKIEGAECREW